MVAMGAKLGAIEGMDGVMAEPDFSDWFAAEGAELLAEKLGRPLPLMGLYLVRRAVRIRPDWLDPAAVDLGDPLALQLLELAQTIAAG